MKHFLIDKKLNIVKAMADRPFVVVDKDKDRYVAISVEDSNAPYDSLEFYKIIKDDKGNYNIQPMNDEEIEQIKRIRFEKSKQTLIRNLEILVKEYIESKLYNWGSTYQEILSELHNTAQVKKIYCLALLTANDIDATESTITSMFLEAYNKQTFDKLSATIKSLPNDTRNDFIQSFVQGCEAAIYQFWIEKIWDWEEQEENRVKSLTYPSSLPLYTRNTLESKFPLPDTSFLNSLRS